jgi:hypothetical protein
LAMSDVHGSDRSRPFTRQSGLLSVVLFTEKPRI